MKRVVIFGFNQFAREVARRVEGVELIIATFSPEEEVKAKKEFFEVVLLKDFTEGEFKFIRGDEVVVCSLKEDEKNLFLALTLKSLFPNVKLVARINDKKNEQKYRLIGVEKLINPYDIVTNLIFTILEKPVILETLEQIVFKSRNTSWQLREVEICSNSPLTREPLKEWIKHLTIRYDLVPVAVVRKGRGGRERVIFISGALHRPLRAGDNLVLIGLHANFKRFEQELYCRLI